ncbi:carbohydrate-binding protein [Fulvivirga sp. 29W222]|uniref:Carbohydrate-binding protein n=1 Tax=Fulvivirga marina TaxID=2494733 RepID=A0A937G4P2_9BACT|nr:beta-1,3-glucanase family protein [Fulvivirga marina]MBL6449963.1 carbohydrate-binding protein [Fulvivirga marina]
MKSLIPLTRVKRTVLLLVMLIPMLSIAQVTVPFKIENHSGLPDNQLFVAIVGEDLAVPSNHIWVDPSTGAQLPMSPAYNTVQGPVYGGNQGPGQNGLYADCFKRLSDISNNTVMVPPIQGCRIFIAYEEQLYFYFFGSSGAQRGYTSPNATDPTDPNQGIRYEVIELTNNQYGMFANTTRVDSYQYPIGMELFGSDGYYKKVGEIATHEEIVAAFQTSVPAEFQKCLDPETGEITAPSKTPEFADGSVGSMPVPGPYVNYMKPYVDAVWNKYAGEDLIFDAGDAGVWKGRVQGEQLVMVSQSPAFLGRKAIITRRPTTQEVFEGKGVLDNVVQDATTDLLVQAQLCAALNRHVIDINTPNPGLQDWSDDSKYYQASPCNHYAKFWHQQGISVDRLSYGFAYDDVFDYSSSVHTPNPSQVIINIGPYSGDNNNGTPIPATIQAENFTNMSGIQLEVTTDQGGGQNVGWIDAGDWMEYTINAPEAGNYTVEYRVASLNAGGVIEFFTNGSSKGTTTFNATGGWQNWTTVSTTVNLSAGNQTIRLVSNNSGWNINWIAFKSSANPPQNGCNISVNADFSVEISEDANNPRLTFVPKRSGVGSSTCILYYSTSANNPYPGYMVAANTPYQINASAGQTIYFYYTYSLPEGGENNTLNNKKSFIVGNCGQANAARTSSTTSEIDKSGEQLVNTPILYPNPADDYLNIGKLPEHVTEIIIYDNTGKSHLTLNAIEGQQISLDVTHLRKGLHFIRIQSQKGVTTIPFIKK